MVKKLFNEDPYLTECDAKVISVNGNKIRLDQTIFFAFSGGQATDRGTIGGIDVLDAVVVKGDDEFGSQDDIDYTLAQEPPFAVGDTVKIIIDDDYRNTIRKLHSAVHVACEFWEKKTGIKEYIGSNVEVTKGRFDFEYAESVSSLLPELEKQCNDFISGNHEVKRYDDPEKPGRRIWECQDIVMPCGGTHVRNTSEIGKIRLKRKNIGSGKERIEVILVG